MNTQDWSPLGWTGWISLQSKGLSRVFSNTTVQKHQFFGAQFFLIVQLSYPYMTTGKTITLTRWTFVGKVMSLLFNMLSRLVITFLPRSKHLLISWLQSPSAVQAWWTIIIREWWEPSRSHSLQMSTEGFPCQQPCLFLWLCWLFCRFTWVFFSCDKHRLLLVAVPGLSFWWLLLLQSTGPKHVAFSSWGTQAQSLSLVGSRAQAQ